MPIYMKMDGIDGQVEKSTPSISELVVTKTVDGTSTQFFPEDRPGDAFAAYGSGETAGAHSGGVNVVMGDGSVRFLSDSIGSVTFSDFDLV